MIRPNMAMILAKMKQYLNNPGSGHCMDENATDMKLTSTVHEGSPVVFIPINDVPCACGLCLRFVVSVTD